MNTNRVIEELVTIWAVPLRERPPGKEKAVLFRNPSITASEALQRLGVTFSTSEIRGGINSFLEAMAHEYESGALPYDVKYMARIELTARANLCFQVVLASDEPIIQHTVLCRVVQAFPVLQWYLVIRDMIRRFCSQDDVLQALLNGMRSTNVAQQESCILGLAYYEGYAQTSNHLAGLIQEIDSQLHFLASQHQQLAQAAENGRVNLRRWAASMV